MSLSTGSVHQIRVIPPKIVSQSDAVLQVSSCEKRLVQGVYRYRCELNDGQQSIWALFATQCTSDFDNRHIIVGSIIRIRSIIRTEKEGVGLYVNINFS